MESLGTKGAMSRHLKLVPRYYNSFQEFLDHIAFISFQDEKDNISSSSSQKMGGSLSQGSVFISVNFLRFIKCPQIKPTSSGQDKGHTIKLLTHCLVAIVLGGDLHLGQKNVHIYFWATICGLDKARSRLKRTGLLLIYIFFYDKYY